MPKAPVSPEPKEEHTMEQLDEPLQDVMRRFLTMDWPTANAGLSDEHQQEKDSSLGSKSSWDWWPSSLTRAQKIAAGNAVSPRPIEAETMIKDFTEASEASTPAKSQATVACSWAHAQATAQDSTTFTMTVQNMDYAKLKADFTLLSAFATALQMAIASEDGLGMVPSFVGFIGGPLIVQAIIILPDGVSASDLNSRLPAASAQLARIAATAVANVDGIERVSAGPITVSQISPPTVPMLAGIQGTWKKESNTYVIRGSTLYFHNGGKTQVVPTSTSTFRLTHPSGAVLEATLESNGQMLKWSSGSKWYRAAPDPVADLQRSLRESVLLANHAIDKRCDQAERTLHKMQKEREQLAQGWEEIRESRSALNEKMQKLQDMLKEVKQVPAPTRSLATLPSCQAICLCPKADAQKVVEDKMDREVGSPAIGIRSQSVLPSKTSKSLSVSVLDNNQSHVFRPRSSRMPPQPNSARAQPHSSRTSTAQVMPKHIGAENDASMDAASMKGSQPMKGSLPAHGSADNAPRDRIKVPPMASQILHSPANGGA